MGDDQQSVAGILRNMSWGASGTPLSALAGGGEVQGETAAYSGGGGDELSQQAQQEQLQLLHQRALAQAAQAVGLDPMAMAAMAPMMPNLSGAQAALAGASGVPMPPTFGQQEGVPTAPAASAATALISMPGMVAGMEAGEGEGLDDGIEATFTCEVCRKAFKREMNLIFHMTTHRPRQPDEAEPLVDASAASSAPVKCQDCDKTFATKYQAKKHYLRRHFAGEKPFACPKCHKKRFVVKEDLTMHMKACGNVYICKCGIRLCSLGALKRHCKYFSHEALSHEPQPEPSTMLQIGDASGSGMPPPAGYAQGPATQPLQWSGQIDGLQDTNRPGYPPEGTSARYAAAVASQQQQAAQQAAMGPPMGTAVQPPSASYGDLSEAMPAMMAMSQAAMSQPPLSTSVPPPAAAAAAGPALTQAQWEGMSTMAQGVAVQGSLGAEATEQLRALSAQALVQAAGMAPQPAADK